VPFTLGYIERPILSEVALTYACTVKCRFCYAGCACVSANGSCGKPGGLPAPRATVPGSKTDFRKILDVIRNEAEVPSVSFSGGEPMLSQDIFELISYAHGTLGMRVNLITNGTLIDVGIARQLKEAGLASAQVSIEADCATVHDAITGVPGSFEASVNGLVSLRRHLCTSARDTLQVQLRSHRKYGAIRQGTGYRPVLPQHGDPRRSCA
jgi:MoaA/NifB/PqqE/SkfB family radical SAM enzyme